MPNTADKFFWGATVSAHAVEGQDFHSDWWRWEQRPRRIAGGGTSEVASGHWERYRDDLQLAAKGGLNTLLYGLSWARIEPEPGRFNAEALDQYRDAFQRMRKLGIQPIAVLQEHSMPAWFAAQGAWDAPEAPKCFRRYCERLYQAIGDCCQHWIPSLEPVLWQRMVYGEKRWPMPRRRGYFPSVGLQGITACHRAAWEFFSAQDGNHRVGLSITAPGLSPADPHSPWDHHVLRWQRHHLERALPNALGGDTPQDRAFSFLALSVPGRQFVHLAARRLGGRLAGYESPPGTPGSADSATPKAGTIHEALQRSARWNVPMLVTGAGLAGEDDVLRCAFLLERAHEVLDCRGRGMNVMGFCYRSLLDGFEWRYGFTRRYGLIHVDRMSLARTPNPSLFLYQDIARHDEIRPGTIARFCPGWQAPRREAC